MTISAASYSSKGNRSRNEDQLSLLENSGGIIAAVADGLGGEGNGDIASLIAIQTINARLLGNHTTMEKMEKAIISANEEIIKMHDNDNRMKSTVAVLCLGGTRAIAATVGDTRIYQFRKGKVIYQSTDHSVSQMSVSVGKINADKIRGHVDRHRLTRSLGSRKTVEADLAELILFLMDAFLLCSDGFWELVLEEEMAEDLRTSKNAEEWLNKMRGRIESRISPTGDNHSAIAIIMTEKDDSI
ncbi:MAG: protein phosphatase 2C domain-containing protein [Peptococcaceae bacterium]|nr:protein phosphatase 2C domain-containing protein [Peptococcaceae bacterium]